jgi:hypothetical protein
MTVVHLEFDRLVAEYHARFGSQEQLRGFGGGPTFLEMWVPDPDVTESVCNLIESAQAGGMDTFVIALSGNSFAQLNLPKLESYLSAGTILLADAKDRSVPLLRISTKSRENLDVHAAYQEGIRRSARTFTHRRALSVAHPCFTASVNHDGASVSVALDPRTHEIIDMVWDGDVGPTRAGLLERYCSKSVGLSIEECIEHGAQRVEFDLRDHTLPRPVRGIVLASNGDPCFELVCSLSTALEAACRDGGFSLDYPNRFVDLPSSRWSALSSAEQTAAAATVLRTLLADERFERSDARIVGVERATRVTVRFAEGAASTDKQDVMVALERKLKSELDPTLCVFAEEAVDANQLRSIREVKRS